MGHYFTGCWIRTFFIVDLLPIGLCRRLENRNGGRHGGPKKYTLICRNEKVDLKIGNGLIYIPLLKE